MEKAEGQLREIQLVGLDLLEQFDAVCKKLNLRYTISCGTLLGAVRHGGFIPWDDDIDVSMPREDYDRFLKEAQPHFAEKYFIQHFTTEKNVPNYFIKIRNSDTTWITCQDEKLNINHGIGMDIFPLDRFENRASAKKLAKKFRRLNRMNSCYDFGYLKTIDSPVKKLGGFIYFILGRLAGRARLYKQIDKLSRVTGKGDRTFADRSKKDKVFPYALYEEFGEIEFEGKVFSCITNKEGYLTIMYGDDYMQPPPPEKRVAHTAETVDCHKPYTEYIKRGKK